MKGGEVKYEYNWTTEKSDRDRLKEKHGYVMFDYYLVKSAVEPAKKCISESPTRPQGIWQEWHEMDDKAGNAPWYVL